MLRTIHDEIEATDGTTIKLGVALSTGAPNFTHEELAAAFDLVADPENWKNAIDAVLPAEGLEVDKVAAAVEYFTATEATFEVHGDQVRVTAPGYYSGPAA